MAAIKPTRELVSPEAVLAKTGKTVEHWFKVLDDFDAKAKGHKAAAIMLQNDHGVSLWWSHTLTVDYEQARGIRQPGQRSGGHYSVTVSKTVGVSAQRAFDAWSSAQGWDSWFSTGTTLDFRVGGAYSTNDKDTGVVTKIVTPGERKGTGEVARIEFTWENAGHCPGTKVYVQFFDKGPDKSQVAVTHDSLPDQKGCEDMKEGWSWALVSLKSWLESGKPVDYEEWKASQKG